MSKHTGCIFIKIFLGDSIFNFLGIGNLNDRENDRLICHQLAETKSLIVGGLLDDDGRNPEPGVDVVVFERPNRVVETFWREI